MPDLEPSKSAVTNSLSSSDAQRGYREGKLKFELHGEKLRGGFTLVRMRHRDDERQPSWLLIKERDGNARPATEFDVLEAMPDSVLKPATKKTAAKAARKDVVGFASLAVQVGQQLPCGRRERHAVQRLLFRGRAGLNPNACGGVYIGPLCGQYLAATFMDYLMPTTTNVPNFEIHHVDTILTDPDVNFRGVGEGGMIVAPACLTNAIEDALQPFGVRVEEQHLPPARILELIGVVPS